MKAKRSAKVIKLPIASAIRRADAGRHAIGGRRHRLGDPLQHVASSRGKGVGATHQASQGRARIDSRRTWRVTAHRGWRADHPKWIYALSAEARNQSDISAATSHCPNGLSLLDGSGSISFDVLSWLAEQKVSLIRIDWKGDIVCVAGASGYSANPFRVRWQLETRENPEQRNEFCRSIITRKIEASIITLEKSIPRSDKWERAMKSAYAALVSP